MRMYDLTVNLLAEDERHAQRILDRITSLLASEQMVLEVGWLEDVTEHATEENELTNEEVDAQLRLRETFFINRLNRINQTRI